MLSPLLTVWLLYLGAMVSPGPNVLLVSQLAAGSGLRSAWLAGLGVAFGAGVWASCAVLGVHAFFSAFPGLRLALQLLGGLYLVYIATRLWSSGAGSVDFHASARSQWVAFRMGALTNLTNPKAALFFGSVFATSFPAQPSAQLQLGAIAVVVFSAIAWYTFLAFVFSHSAVVQRYARVSSLVSRVASACFAAIGLSLLCGTVREARSRLAANDA
jgi:threonine efflux protein